MGLYAKGEPESRFREMKFGRDLTVDDGGNYVTFHEKDFISYNPGTEPTLNHAISVVYNLSR